MQRSTPALLLLAACGGGDAGVSTPASSVASVFRGVPAAPSPVTPWTYPVANVADRDAFLLWQTGHEDFQPGTTGADEEQTRKEDRGLRDFDDSWRRASTRAGERLLTATLEEPTCHPTMIVERYADPAEV